jgi:uncharacterized iron-regulated membrane protein
MTFFRTAKSFPTKKSKKGPSAFKKISSVLHLWLGLASGMIVFIVSITGAIYVFEREICNTAEPWRFVNPSGQKLKPSVLYQIAKKTLGDKQATGIRYGLPDEAAEVSAYSRKDGYYIVVYINPYTGKLLKKTITDYNKPAFDFFQFVLNGHRALWLPYKIGRPIVGVAVLVFVVLMITGMVLWWPQKWIKSIRDKSFKVKWNASFKRVNYDLHNVLGFYSMLFLFIITLTGLIWSFEWVSKSIYWATSGGKSLPEFSKTLSDSTSTKTFTLASIDALWIKLNQNKQPEGLNFSLPQKKADVIQIIETLRAGTYYTNNFLSFDQYSLTPIKGSGINARSYADATFANKLRRMNYDLPVGAILGIPGKLIAFFASLIAASLPVTGFYIWWGRRNKKPAKKRVITSVNSLNAQGIM